MEQQIDLSNISIEDISKKGTIILFGNTHGFIDDLSIQEMLIDLFKPKSYLFELLEDKNLFNLKEITDFLKRNKDEYFSITTKNSQIQEVVSRLMNHNLQFIGCDLKNLGRKNKEELIRTSLTKEEEEYEEQLLKKRETVQAKKVISVINSTKKPVFLSVGAYHLREFSYLLQELKGHSLFVAQPFYEDEALFEPKENIIKENIKYKIKKIF
ncbi:MAG TPA: hypothetical protein VHA12_00040 [Candidatus Nanoarchaeia archaeon]|nr:hypothetical protein [Candidatus Nanoarchaeia archaeon]